MHLHLLDFVEIGGSLLILAAFAAGQLQRWSPHSVRYLAFNLAGSSVLAVIALIRHTWGFLLLEGTWAIVSLSSLLVVAARARSTRAGDARAGDEAAGARDADRVGCEDHPGR